MSKLASGLEVIAFQLNSGLGKALEEAFQDALNFRDTIDYSRIDDKDKVSYRRTMVHDYAKRTLFPAMIKAIGATSNLTIKKIVDTNYFCGMFAVDMSMDDVKDVIPILARQTGDHSGKRTTLTESMIEVSKINELVDQNKSRLKSTTFGKSKRPISAVMYMDVDMAFLMSDNLPRGAVDEFTAQELTAIYLHEIGHLFTLLDQSANAYQVYETSKDHLKVISHDRRSADLGNLTKAYRTSIRPQLAEASRKRLMSDKVVKTFDILADKTDELLNTYTGDYVYGTFELAINILFNMWLSACAILTRVCMMLVTHPMLRGLLFLIGEQPGSYGKTTDQSTSTSVYYHAERMADQFAARHGYGAHLATGLSKVVNAFRYMSSIPLLGRIDSGSLRNSTAMLWHLKITLAVSELLRIDGGSLGQDFFGPSNYEDDCNRLESILKDTRAAFKQDLPPVAVNQYLSDIDRIQKAIKDIRKPAPMRATKLLWDMVFDFPAVLSRLAQMDDMEEMEKYLSRLTGIINNDLYASAAAFKHLA